MASPMGFIGYLMVAATLIVAATASTHVVLDNLGWNIPPAGNIAYRTWANFQDFQIGDTLEFRWTGTHDVARVTKDEYDNCTAFNPIGPIQTTSPVTFTIDSNSSSFYFICNVDTHCQLGQKLQVTVGSSSAPSIAASAISALFLAMAISFLGIV